MASPFPQIALKMPSCRGQPVENSRLPVENLWKIRPLSVESLGETCGKQDEQKKFSIIQKKFLERHPQPQMLLLQVEQRGKVRPYTQSANPSNSADLPARTRNSARSPAHTKKTGLPLKSGLKALTNMSRGSTSVSGSDRLHRRSQPLAPQHRGRPFCARSRRDGRNPP